METSGKYHPDVVKGDFEMTGVDFTYSNGTQALFEVSMHIPAGKITALVGLSGAGKSTVVHHLLELHPEFEFTVSVIFCPPDTVASVSHTSTFFNLKQPSTVRILQTN